MPQPSKNYAKSNLAWTYIFWWWDFIKATVFCQHGVLNQVTRMEINTVHKFVSEVLVILSLIG